MYASTFFPPVYIHLTFIAFDWNWCKNENYYPSKFIRLKIQSTETRSSNTEKNVKNKHFNHLLTLKIKIPNTFFKNFFNFMSHCETGNKHIHSRKEFVSCLFHHLECVRRITTKVNFRIVWKLFRIFRSVVLCRRMLDKQSWQIATMHMHVIAMRNTQWPCLRKVST